MLPTFPLVFFSFHPRPEWAIKLCLEHSRASLPRVPNPSTFLPPLSSKGSRTPRQGPHRAVAEALTNYVGQYKLGVSYWSKNLNHQGSSRTATRDLLALSFLILKGRIFLSPILLPPGSLHILGPPEASMAHFGQPVVICPVKQTLLRVSGVSASVLFPVAVIKHPDVGLWCTVLNRRERAGHKCRVHYPCLPVPSSAHAVFITDTDRKDLQRQARCRPALRALMFE